MLKKIKNIWQQFNKKLLARVVIKLAAKVFPKYTFAYNALKIIGDALIEGNEHLIEQELPSGLSKRKK